MHHRKGRGWKDKKTKTKSFIPFYLLVKSLIKGKKGIKESLFYNAKLLFPAVDLVMWFNSNILFKVLKQRK